MPATKARSSRFTRRPGPDKPFPAVGTVASVEGNNIKVTDIDANGNPSQTDVTVTDKTQYSKGRPCNFAGHRARQVHHRRRNDRWGRDTAGNDCRLGPANAKGQCPAACREVATALTTDSTDTTSASRGVLRDVVEDHRAAPMVSRQIFFGKGMFLCAVRHRAFEFAATAAERGLGPSVLSGDRHQR